MYLIFIQFAFTLLFQQQEGGGEALSRDQNQTHLRWCSSEFHKLLRKIQGAPSPSKFKSLMC